MKPDQIKPGMFYPGDLLMVYAHTPVFTPDLDYIGNVGPNDPLLAIGTLRTKFNVFAIVACSIGLVVVQIHLVHPIVSRVGLDERRTA